MADEGLFGGGAAFGVFPQMGGRRRLQDPTASADVPFQGFRGSVAGLLGLLPDVANFMGRSPMPTETFGEFDYGPRQQLPYGSEFYLKELPLAPTSPVGQLAGQVGSFVPLSPMPAVRGAQTVGRMVGQRMAENVAMGRPSLPSMLAEPRASLFAVEPSAMMPKPQAPVSELGFYSAAEQAAMNLARNKGTGQSFLNDLMKAPDVKKDELVWTGLDDFLANKPNVTKQEVQDYLSGNRVDVQEIKLSGKSDSTRPFVEWSPSEQNYLVYADDEIPLGTFNTSREAEKYISDNFGKPTQYDNYQLPGGENYREILLTLPKQSPTTGDIANKLFGKEMRFLSEAEKDAVVAEARKIEDTTPKDYVSSHFNEPNILAHIRVNDRVDADGKKMLLIEEIQSDWHQAGREKGYQNKDGKYGEKVSPEEYKRGVDLQNQQRNQPQPLTLSEQAELDDIMGRHMASIPGARVPDAPFKDTWYQLALKRVLKHAADNGYERVGLTTGKQQAERFDLSKQVDYIDYRVAGTRDNPTYELGVVGKNGEGIDLPKQFYAANELSQVVGKEVAEKIIKGEGKFGGGRKTLSGIDLQVGGEGMKKYYDEIYPKFLDKYGKKWNAKVGETEIKTGQRIQLFGVGKLKTGMEPVRYIDITPEMKGAVSKGQPLFAAAPVGSIGLGYQKDKADNLEETSPTYTDPFGNTIGSSIR
jgi:hypothetical protein